jgi:hypothetical protein
MNGYASGFGTEILYQMAKKLSVMKSKSRWESSMAEELSPMVKIHHRLAINTKVIF